MVGPGGLCDEAQRSQSRGPGLLTVCARGLALFLSGPGVSVLSGPGARPGRGVLCRRRSRSRHPSSPRAACHPALTRVPPIKSALRSHPNTVRPSSSDRVTQLRSARATVHSHVARSTLRARSSQPPPPDPRQLPSACHPALIRVPPIRPRRPSAQAPAPIHAPPIQHRGPPAQIRVPPIQPGAFPFSRREAQTLLFGDFLLSYRKILYLKRINIPIYAYIYVLGSARAL